MNNLLLQRHKLCNRALVCTCFRSPYRFRLIYVLISILIVCWYIVESLTYNLGESAIVIILRSVGHASRNAKLHRDSIYQLAGTTTAYWYSFPGIPFCEAFVTAPHRYSLSILPLRSREHKIKTTSFLKRHPSASPICTMADAPELSVESNGSDLKESSRDASIAQPLYITVGPPCSGKTTWIRKQNDNAAVESTIPKILDICIDDQPGVYHRIPTAFFLPETVYSDNNSTQRHQCLSNVIFGRSIKERINDLSELRAVLLRFANKTTKDDFQKSSTISPILVEVIEEIIGEFESRQQPIELPDTIDIFILEAIFRRSSPSKNPTNTIYENVDEMASISALERTELLLYDTPISIPIAYGNTNTKATDYVKALQMALKLKRPVHFVVYCDDENGDCNNDLFDMTVGSGVQGLIRRNMYRFLETGRYVPEQVIIDMRERTSSMISDILSQQRPSPSIANRKMSKLEFHQQLARLAGFHMNDERLIISTIQDQKSRSDSRGMQHRYEKSKNNELKHDRPTMTSTTPPRQRPWDRPASAVRGYNGELNNYNTKKNANMKGTSLC